MDTVSEDATRALVDKETELGLILSEITLLQNNWTWLSASIGDFDFASLTMRVHGLWH